MVIGKSLTTLGGVGGLRPTIVVTAPNSDNVTCDGRSVVSVSGVYTFTVGIGTHTLVATQGSNTKTQTVLVDSCSLYDIYISLPLYLYNLGDECASVTGGWSSSGYTSIMNKITSGSKFSTYMSFSSSTNSIVLLGTNNSVDITNYRNIYFDINVTSLGGIYGATYDIQPTKTYAEQTLSNVLGTQIVAKQLAQVGYLYVCVATPTVSGDKFTVNRIWLE